MVGWNTDTLAKPPGLGPVTIVEGSAFCISNGNGDIEPEDPHGAFFHDTRLLSRWVLLVDGHHVEPLSATTPEPYRAVLVGRAGHQAGRADTPIIIERDRSIGRGLTERITIRNYSMEPLRCRVEMLLESDFADIFEVKEGRIHSRPRPVTAQADGGMHTQSGHHAGLGLLIEADEPSTEGDYLSFDVLLPSHGSWSRQVRLIPTADGEVIAVGTAPTEGAIESAAFRRFNAWNASLPVPDFSDRTIGQVILQSERDLGPLRIFDPRHPDREVVAAGVPWFMTLFGRDSLLCSYMALPIDPTLALGTLQALAEMQGTEVDLAAEEQPGRILHEVRRGSVVRTALGGASVYYGTADATPLFVCLLGELARWGGLPDDHAALLGAADRALEWMQRYGDRDGDGFIEYQRLNPRGLINQGWKDSWDGINFADGTLAETPIALCEVQGYAYAAFQARAMLASIDGDEDAASSWRQKAEALKAAFNERFWLPDRGYYAIALDGQKRQVDALASNMGHCLWSGIVDDDKAQSVADHLLSEEMFTGWGVRTLSSRMGAYNPASYHNGSVWPHDNAIIAAGLTRYGFTEHAHRITRGIFDAATTFDDRLPELFCGFSRSQYSEPVPYPASCSPQAWAATTPFLLLRSLLRWDPCVPTGDVWLAPTGTAEFGDIRLMNVPFAGSRVTVEATGAGGTILGLPNGLTLHPEPRPELAQLTTWGSW